MIVGVPKEIKIQEFRVAITPAGVAELTGCDHQVLIEKGAGKGSGFSDEEYRQSGAQIVSTKEAWSAQLVIKVKEPLVSEYHYLQGQIIFTFLHLAGVDKNLTRRLIESRTTAIAYETLSDEHGALPILAPMSAIAGNMAALVGAYYLARYNHGNGVLLGRVLDKRHGKVLIVGDGVVGFHAARTLNSMGANVFLAGLTRDRVGRQDSDGLEGVQYFYSEEAAVSRHCLDADLVIGAVLNIGQKAPHIVSEVMVKSMVQGAVVVDVSIDQGGCIETSKATTHDSPIYIKHKVIHYCVSNMPGAYPRSSTIALCDVSLDYIRLLADKGLMKFMKQKQGAVNVYNSKIINEKIASSLNMYEYFDSAYK